MNLRYDSWAKICRKYGNLKWCIYNLISIISWILITVTYTRTTENIKIVWLILLNLYSKLHNTDCHIPLGYILEKQDHLTHLVPITFTLLTKRVSRQIAYMLTHILILNHELHVLPSLSSLITKGKFWCLIRSNPVIMLISFVTISNPTWIYDALHSLYCTHLITLKIDVGLHTAVDHKLYHSHQYMQHVSVVPTIFRH